MFQYIIAYELILDMIGIGWSDKPDGHGGISKKSASRYKISLEGLLTAEEKLINSCIEQNSKSDQPSIIGSLIKKGQGKKRGYPSSDIPKREKKKQGVVSPSSKTLKQYFYKKT